MDGKLVKNVLLLRNFYALMLEALTLPRETKVSEACHMFVSTERYPLNFIFRFPPFKDFM